ncbi:class I SAM-dependent methyltransferase [Aquamicrobium sp. LC103]|uniref:class I SAM-dependent methyltransferase n=1 Tax=Aquamicrobium sp. LC103 TaxID=1120658 RepID=UPI001485818A|nr:class I SAM-dependent methyltransferase [Aquamicrobium sp. LC103]
MSRPNFDLKDEIHEYWSHRAETFDLAFGHYIAAGREAEAWAAPIRDQLGMSPRKVLELACGTGEVTRLLHDLGHDLTALDFSEAMLAKARAKHAGKSGPRFLLADAGDTMEPNASYDAIVCRHLVWTLTDPATAFADWLRILRPGGRLIVYDGDWTKPKASMLWVARLLSFWERVSPDPYYDGAMSEKHAEIMRRLPFREGLTFDRLALELAAAGFVSIRELSHQPIARAQRRGRGLRNRLRTLVYGRFILIAQKPGG